MLSRVLCLYGANDLIVVYTVQIPPVLSITAVSGLIV
jgi:hypothetical protein